MSTMTMEQVRDELRGLASDGMFGIMADAIDAHLATREVEATPVAAGYCVVSNEDASNYDQILGALGMREEGDPLREVNWLLDLKETYRALEARAEWFMESKEVIDFFMDAMPFPATTYIAPGESEHWPAYSHDQMIKIVTDFVRYFGLARNAAPPSAEPVEQPRGEPLIIPQLPYGSASDPTPDFSDLRSTIDEFVNRFLSWELPEDVCADPIACKPGRANRHGTHLLTHDQAKLMVEHVFTGTVSDGWFAGNEDADGNDLVTLRADDPRLTQTKTEYVSPSSYQIANALIDAGWVNNVPKDSVRWAELCAFIINISSAPAIYSAEAKTKPEQAVGDGVEDSMTAQEIHDRLADSRGLGGIELSNEEFRTVLASLSRLTPLPAVATPVEVTDEQCVKFMCVALRHVEYKKGTKGPTCDDIRLGLSLAGIALAAHPHTEYSAVPDGGKAAPKLIGWRMADYTAETDDVEKARNWSSNVSVLPIFEGDPNTKLVAAPEVPKP